MQGRVVSLIPTDPDPVEVPIGTLPPGSRFCMRTPAVWGLPETRVYGELLWYNALRARVLLAGQTKEIAFKDSEEKVRVFNADGSCETSWPLEITVEPLEYNQGAGHAPNPDVRSQDYWQASEGRLTTMDDSKVTQATGIQARYDYNVKLLKKAQDAGDGAKAAVIESKLAGLLKEASDKDITLKTMDAAEEQEQIRQEQTEDAAPAPPAAAKKAVSSKPGATTKKPVSVRGAEQAAAMASIDKAKQKADGKAEPKAAAKPRSSHDCLCGCGKETLSLFAPGHDARVKGIILKVERGDLDRDAIPDMCQPFVSFKGKWKTDGFTLTKSPVRIPGRPEIEHTGLAAMEALDV